MTHAVTPNAERPTGFILLEFRRRTVADSRNRIGSTVAALALTGGIVALVAVSIGGWDGARWALDRSDVSDEPASERVVFVEQPPTEVAPAPVPPSGVGAPTGSPLRAPTTVPRGIPSPSADSAAVRRPGATRGGAGVTGVPGGSGTGPAPTGRAPCAGACLDDARVTFALPGSGPMSRAAQDSALGAWSQKLPELARRPVPLPRDVADSMAREATLNDRDRVAAGGRPGTQTTLGSVAVPLPGGGPSAAKRARDRALHADASARLASIQTRLMQARAESALASGEYAPPPPCTRVARDTTVVQPAWYGLPMRRGELAVTFRPDSPEPARWAAVVGAGAKLLCDDRDRGGRLPGYVVRVADADPEQPQVRAVLARLKQALEVSAAVPSVVKH